MSIRPGARPQRGLNGFDGPIGLPADDERVSASLQGDQVTVEPGRPGAAILHQPFPVSRVEGGVVREDQQRAALAEHPDPERQEIRSIGPIEKPFLRGVGKVIQVLGWLSAGR
jgi:hypothetical protein